MLLKRSSCHLPCFFFFNCYWFDDSIAAGSNYINNGNFPQFDSIGRSGGKLFYHLYDGHT